jgi:riboflavin synthase alpha subunit
MLHFSIVTCKVAGQQVATARFHVRFRLAHACSVTVAGDKGEGDVVNIEVEAQTQAIVDTVERVLQRYLEAGRLPAPATQ